MTQSFDAYIDESGDEGFGKYRAPGGRGGASHWLVLSACVVRRSNSGRLVSWRDDLRTKIRREAKTLHFVQLDHAQRVVAADHLARLPIRIVSILASKKHLDAALFEGRNRLYFFMVRLMVERISWLCRDLRSTVTEGDGTVALTFSRRAAIKSYSAIQDDLEMVRSHPSSIFWPAIDLSRISAEDHSRLAGLQLADIAASSMASAVEYDRYGNCELRYAAHLKRVIFHRSGKFLSHGVTILPGEEKCELSEKQMAFLDLFDDKRQPPGP